MFTDFTERNIDVKETSIISIASPHMPRLGIKPATYVCVLTGNRTSNLSVYWTMLQPAEPPSQG